jgi:hypothetical protein
MVEVPDEHTHGPPVDLLSAGGIALQPGSLCTLHKDPDPAFP